jgi:hypothetical protein
MSPSSVRVQPRTVPFDFCDGQRPVVHYFISIRLISPVSIRPAALDIHAMTIVASIQSVNFTASSSGTFISVILRILLKNVS